MADGGVNLFDLAARITTDTSGSDRALTATQKKVLDLANQFEATEVTAKKSARGMATSMAAVNAEIGKMKVANLSADYDKFANALKRNTVVAQSAADDFLKLLGPVKGAGKETVAAERGANALTRAFQGLSSSAVTLQGPLGGVAGRLGGIRALTGQATTLAGALGVGFGVAAVGATALGVAIFELASHAGEVAGKFNDLSQQTKFSVETLSALSALARTSGTTIEAVQPALAHFEEHLGKVGKSSADMEVELRKAFKSVHTLNESAELFGMRGGRAMLGIIQEAHGDFDKASEELERMGLIMSTRAAVAADQFSDHMEALRMKLEMMGVQIGLKLMPTIEGAISEVGRALGLNQNSWQSWGDYIASVLNGVVITTAASVAAINQALSNIKTGFQTGFSQIGRIAGSAILGTSSNPGLRGIAGSSLYDEFIGKSRDPYGWANLQTPGQAYDAERSRMLNLAAQQPSSIPRSRGVAGAVPRSGGGGGGTDVNDFIKGLQLQEKAATRTYQTLTHLLDTFYSHHKIGLADYVTQEVKASQDELAAKLRTIDAELKATDKLKGSARVLKRKEILDKQASIESEFNKRQFDLAVKQSDMMTALAESARAMQVGIETEKDTRLINIARGLADQRIITGETTERILADMEIRALKRERKTLQDKQRDARNDVDESEKIANQIAVVDAKIATAEENKGTRVGAARRKDIDDLRAWGRATLDILSDVITRDSETTKRRIELLQQIGQIKPKAARAQIAGIDLREENTRFAKESDGIVRQLEELKTQAVEAEQAAITLAAKIGEDAAEEAFKRAAEIRERYSAILGDLKSVTSAHKETVSEIQSRELVLTREKIHKFAEDLSSTIDSALRRGFHDGMKSGLIEFAQGLLQMIESKALDKLADSITDAILKGVTNAQGSGGGGSWWQKLLGILIGAAAGAVGGSVAGGGGANPISSGIIHEMGHAAGGPYGPGQLFPVNELGPEMFFHQGSQDMMWTGGHSGTVVPNSAIQKSAQPIHVTINVNGVQRPQDFMSKPTQRQMADAARKALTHASLTG